MSTTALAQDPEKIKRTSENVRLLQYKNFGYAKCARCGLPVTECEPRMVDFGRGSAWTLCTYCWPKTTVDERLTHYKAWWYDNKYQYDRDGYSGQFEKDYNFDEMVNAVTEGKESKFP